MLSHFITLCVYRTLPPPFYSDAMPRVAPPFCNDSIRSVAPSFYNDSIRTTQLPPPTYDDVIRSCTIHVDYSTRSVDDLMLSSISNNNNYNTRTHTQTDSF